MNPVRVAILLWMESINSFTKSEFIETFTPTEGKLAGKVYIAEQYWTWLTNQGFIQEITSGNWAITKEAVHILNVKRDKGQVLVGLDGVTLGENNKVFDNKE